MRRLPRNADGENTDIELALGVLTIPLLLLALVAAALWLPESMVPRCRMVSAFGIPCPTCGGVRALRLLLLHGRFGAAFVLQPFAIMAGLGAIAYSVHAFGVVFGGWRPRRLSGLSRMDRWCLLGVVLLFTATDWLYVWTGSLPS